MDSWSPWWCQPDTIPASVRTDPTHIPSVANASRRSMPGVGAAGTCASPRVSSTSDASPMSRSYAGVRARH